MERYLPDLAAVIDRARAAHPAIPVSDEVFERAIAVRIAANPAVDPSAMAWSDVYLVCACLAGDPAALRTLEATLGDVRRALGAAEAEADDLMQRLRERLLVGDPPTLAQYSGRGSLRRWLRVSALNMMLNAVRDRPDEVPLDELLIRDVERSRVDPKLELVKHRHRDQLRDALREALRSLSARQRTALRLHVLDGVTLDQLAALHGVHRATIARWLAQSRELVVQRTLEGIEDRVGVGRDEAESLLALLMSRLDPTIDRLADDSITG